jgi:hypothetical protein
MNKLYDLEIDLSSNDGGLPRDSFKDWMRVHLHGHAVERKVSLPPVIGSVYFHNTGGDDVVLRRGAALPIRVARGSIIHVMLDGSAAGMWKVEG